MYLAFRVTNMRSNYNCNIYPGLHSPLLMILTPLYFFLLFHIFPLGITEGQPLPYIPEDNIALDCGSEGTKTLRSNRSWDGDINSKLFSSKEGQNERSITSLVVDQSHMEMEVVPYSTARLSLSEFTYKIPVTPGPKFVRLHFLATTYQNFSHPNSKAFFSVKVDQFTLLRNFSVFLAADALGRRGIVKEFCVTVKNSDNLIISFSPSPTPGAFAFINGIEVVSMPTYLYYPEAVESDRSPRLVGENSIYQLTTDSALEMVYRINIGGYVFPPNRDTGLFRSWEDDDAYFTKQEYSRLPIEVANALNFTKVPTYTAPEAVYRTARSMGNITRAIIERYNLTWEYPVDSGFYYLVRLHFCEIVKEISSISDRVFYIFIANQTAEERADVILWSGGQYVPYKKAYVVAMFGKGGEKKLNLSIALHANPDWISRYADAILNGLEIFKLNDSSGNLAGPNPDPIQKVVPDSPSQHQEGKKTNKRTAMIGIVKVVSCLLSGLILFCGLGFYILQRRKKVKESGSSNNHQCTPLPTELCRYFSFTEIQTATNNFDDNFIIGVGGFGNVYKAHIDDGATTVAVKRLKRQSSQGALEFKTEIEMLSHLRHRHLVCLIGYCNEYDEMILVYEYMPRGTLSNHLYNTDNPPLTWKQRLQICIGAASGLRHYLHRGVKHTIIHRDVKTNNILLDERFVAKVSDFGLSKLGPMTTSKTHVSTMVKGTLGYLDPEYYRRQLLTEKSDVYSFGIVLCEVLCGRPPIMRTLEKKQMNLAEWVRTCHEERKLHQIVDPYLVGKIAPECLKKFGEIAVSCVLENGAERPSMKEVLRELEFAMQLQNNEEENIRLGGEPSEIMEDGTIRIRCGWEDNSGAVFSDIKGFQGR